MPHFVIEQSRRAMRSTLAPVPIWYNCRLICKIDATCDRLALTRYCCCCCCCCCYELCKLKSAIDVLHFVHIIRILSLYLESESNQPNRCFDRGCEYCKVSHLVLRLSAWARVLLHWSLATWFGSLLGLDTIIDENWFAFVLHCIGASSVGRRCCKFLHINLHQVWFTDVDCL